MNSDLTPNLTTAIRTLTEVVLCQQKLIEGILEELNLLNKPVPTQGKTQREVDELKRMMGLEGIE